jgi:hypothetical protein
MADGGAQARRLTSKLLDMKQKSTGNCKQEKQNEHRND